MIILAIESSGLVASVCLAQEDKIIAEESIQHKLTHSETLMPMVHHMMEAVGFDLSVVDAIAVTSGPGSFTGLRIGAAAAKGFSLGLSKPIIPVPTLDALAYNIYDTNKIICPIMDARRNEVYTSLYRWEQGAMVQIEKADAVNIELLYERLVFLQKPVVFVGDGVKVHRDFLAGSERGQLFSFAPIHASAQRAAAVAALAFQRTDKAVSSQGFTLEYLRKSQAEREYEEKRGAGE